MGTYDAVIEDDAAEFLADTANGDARAALNAVELGILTTERGPDGKIHIDLAVAQECIQKRVVRYDKNGDNHYDTVSAFIKSMRGSDPDAAVYYLARMLYAGEDIKFIARRIMICASEDVGNADPQALTVAVSAAQAVERIGMPIRDFFAQQGEARFRQIEAEILAEVTLQTGQIIATGGGIVKDWENVRRLRQSGKVYFLDRSLDQLETDPSRPLSSSREALRQLYDQRIDLYRAACDQQIENNGSADQTARRLWQDWLTEITGLID